MPKKRTRSGTIFGIDVETSTYTDSHQPSVVEDNFCEKIVLGSVETINQNDAIVFGNSCIVNGNNCIVFGNCCIVNGRYAIVIGDRCTINGNNARVIGKHAQVSGSGPPPPFANHELAYAHACKKVHDLDGNTISVWGKSINLKSHAYMDELEHTVSPYIELPFGGFIITNRLDGSTKMEFYLSETSIKGRQRDQLPEFSQDKKDIPEYVIKRLLNVLVDEYRGIMNGPFSHDVTTSAQNTSTLPSRSVYVNHDNGTIMNDQHSSETELEDDIIPSRNVYVNYGSGTIMHSTGNISFPTIAQPRLSAWTPENVRAHMHSTATSSTLEKTKSKKKKKVNDHWSDQLDPSHDIKGETCVICMDHEKKVFINPCGHTSLCITCAKELYTKNKIALTCPICRKPISSIKEMF